MILSLCFQSFESSFKLAELYLYRKYARKYAVKYVHRIGLVPLRKYGPITKTVLNIMNWAFTRKTRQCV